MKQEDKELLIKDLCARLPYSVKVVCLRDFNHKWYNLEMVDIGDNEVYVTTYEPYANRYVKIEEVKPYLFPLSSINKEKREEIEILVFNEWYEPNSCKVDSEGYIEILGNYDFSGIYPEFCKDFVNYLLSNHFDINGLIPKGLAVDATGLGIY